MDGRPTPADRALREATERIFAAIKARDVSILGDVLADDFVLTSPGNPDQDRLAFLQAIEAAPYRLLEIHGENVGVRVLGDVALVSGIQQARVELPDGTVATGATAFVDCFTRRGDRWRLRHAVSFELPGGGGP